jgi:RNA polymerase-binding protein DksA
MSPVDTERFRALLNEERARIVKEIEFLHDENPGSIEDETGEETHYDQHPADAATATHDREVDYTIEEDASDLLRQIDAALKRIDAGTYGICRVCGREIGEERLEAVPWTDLCIDDARKLHP